MTGPHLAPFALVRMAALAHPAPVVSDFRTAMTDLVAFESAVSRLAPAVADALYSSAPGHSAEFHRRVVLPLRRAVHNRRAFRRTDLGDLPARVPLLREWLDAQDAMAAQQSLVLDRWPEALATERGVLADLCAAEPLRRAAALIGPDLLHGLARAGADDRRARKAEATVLRYALRATSKTSPLSWFTYVAWGRWDDGAGLDQEPTARSQVNQVLVAQLSAARQRDSVPHRLAPALRVRDGRVTFRRDIPVPGSTRAYVTKEESVDIAATPPLRFVLDTVGPEGMPPAGLARLLATKLPEGQAQAAAKFVNRLLDIGLLIPAAPIDPQDPDPLAALGFPELAEATESFAALDSPERPARLSELSSQWSALGHPGVPPVVEDVVLPRVVRVDRSGMDTLARLTPLMMLFDRQLLVRRIARDEFVRRFGPGASAHPADCADLFADALMAALSGPPVAKAELGEITDGMLEMAAGVRPARPVAYSWFVQRTPDGLVVNHCYAGFTRFASRFLNQLPPAARIDVVNYLSVIFPAGITQFRPVGGFTANLHPKLGQEVGEDPRWSDLTPDDLVLRHDQDHDELRLVYQGHPIDVLYLGFLMPLMLPDRVTALYTDLSCGWPDLDSLRSTVDHDGVVERGRLWYRDVVLARRSWDFPSVPDLGRAPDVALAAARWRAKYGLPEHVFVGAGGGITSMADFEARLGAPKPQYVDLGNALHLRCLPKTLSRYTGPVRVTEALPVPAGQVVELIAETWWRTS